jgi:chemotaxis methyl-accepting protein methylase
MGVSGSSMKFHNYFIGWQEILSNEVADVAPRRLQRFFAKVDGSYRIVKTIRDLCVFGPHNIFKDPPFSKLDFISCCNLMSYLDTLLQKRFLLFSIMRLTLMVT